MTELTVASLGLVDEQCSGLSSEHAQLLAATLDIAFTAGTPLPLLWHWAYFNPVVSSANLGADGHPVRDHPLLLDFPRRMWVGGEVRSGRPLLTDAPAVRRTRLIEYAVKHGSTGDLLIVNLEHSIEQAGSIAVTERQDVIYRDANSVTPPPGGPAEVSAPEGGWIETVDPTEALLFRFSALTFNAHRIHYDAEYATRVEHYPGIVVPAPLTAMLLAGSASSHLGRPLQSFSFRASAPLFANQPILIIGLVADTTTTMTATRSDGVTAMTASAN